VMPVGATRGKRPAGSDPREATRS